MNIPHISEIVGNTPLREVLASGIGIVQNTDLRIDACKRIIKSWSEQHVAAGGSRYFEDDDSRMKAESRSGFKGEDP